jgi:hypothetical protein
MQAGADQRIAARLEQGGEQQCGEDREIGQARLRKEAPGTIAGFGAGVQGRQVRRRSAPGAGPARS